MITILNRIDLYVTQSPTKNLSTTKIVVDSVCTADCSVASLTVKTEMRI
jgi:hypothetical protein